MTLLEFGVLPLLALASAVGLTFAPFVLVQALTGFTSIGRFGGRSYLGQSSARQFDNLGDSGYDGYRGD